MVQLRVIAAHGLASAWEVATVEVDGKWTSKQITVRNGTAVFELWLKPDDTDGIRFQICPTSLPGVGRLLTKLQVHSRFAQLALVEMLTGVGDQLNHTRPAHDTSTATEASGSAAHATPQATPGPVAEAQGAGSTITGSSVAGAAGGRWSTAQVHRAGGGPAALIGPAASGWHSVRLLLSEQGFRERAVQKLGRAASVLTRGASLAHGHSSVMGSALSAVGRPHVWDPVLHANQPYLEVQYCLTSEDEEADEQGGGGGEAGEPADAAGGEGNDQRTPMQSHAPSEADEQSVVTAPVMHVIEVRQPAPRCSTSCRLVPEFDLPLPLARHAHSYAHGGFMGAACSLVSDAAWMNILVKAHDEPDAIHMSGMLGRSTEAALAAGGWRAAYPHVQPEALVLMGRLENSPVLCAYGLVRTRSTVPVEQQPHKADDSSQAAWHSPPVLPLDLAPRMLLQPPGGVNCYGYRVVALEWDLWLSPTQWWSLLHAAVDHGSALQLVQQTLAMGLGCGIVARKFGSAHNSSSGVSPAAWLTAFGRALALGVTGDVATPLRLDAGAESEAEAAGRVQRFVRLALEGVEVEGVQGTLAGRPNLGLRVRVLGNTHTTAEVVLDVRQRGNSSAGSVGGSGPVDLAAVTLPSGLGVTGDGAAPVRRAGALPLRARSFYPLDPRGSGEGGLGGSHTTMLVVEVVEVGAPKKPLGRAVVPLEQLLSAAASAPGPTSLAALSSAEVGMVLEGKVVWMGAAHKPALQPSSTLPAAVGMPRAGAGQRGVPRRLGSAGGGARSDREGSPADEGDGADEEEGEEEEEDDVEEGGEEEGGSRVVVRVTWAWVDVVSEAQAALGLSAAEAQSCVAMLAEPGGLFLDIKSAYSKAYHLRTIISSLNGVGVHVRALCSFNPKQLHFQGTPLGGATSAVALGGASAIKSSAATGLSSGGGAASNVGASSRTASPSQVLATQAAGLGAHTSGDGCAAVAPVSAGSDTAIRRSGRAHDTPQAPPTSLAPPIEASLKRLSTRRYHPPMSPPPHFDSVLFFHGLNGLEAAVENGEVPRGTCVLFNGASFLLEDPGQAYVTGDSSGAHNAGAGGKETDGKKGDGKEGAGKDKASQGGSKGKEDGGGGGERAEAAPGAHAAHVTTAGTASIMQQTTGILAPQDVCGAPLSRQSVAESAITGGAAGEATNNGIGIGGAGAARQGAGAARALRSEGLGGLTDLPPLIDLEAWRRYCVLVEVHGVYGGLYVQEPDASPSAVAALIELVNRAAAYLPLGFAYGHLPRKVIAVAGAHGGRGFASQQILEELGARKALGTNVRSAIAHGVHTGASAAVTISWGRRLLYTPGTFWLHQQRPLLWLLADFQPVSQLPDLLDELGGLEFIFLRFYDHYESTSPLTLHESGFNFNLTKGLLRLLRNKGVFAALTTDRKRQLVSFFSHDRRLRLKAHWCGVADGHKLAKEGLVCVLESCDDEEELDKVLGGLAPSNASRFLRGWTRLAGCRYWQRVVDARAALQAHPGTAAYLTTRYGHLQYIRDAPDEQVATGDVTKVPWRTRRKPWWEKLWRLARKALCCGFTCCCNTWCWTCSSGIWGLYCVPMLLYPYLNRWLMLVVLLIVTAFAVLVVLATIGGIVGGIQASAADYEDYEDGNSTTNGTALNVTANTTRHLIAFGARRLLLHLQPVPQLRWDDVPDHEG